MLELLKKILGIKSRNEIKFQTFRKEIVGNVSWYYAVNYKSQKVLCITKYDSFHIPEMKYAVYYTCMANGEGGVEISCEEYFKIYKESLEHLSTFNIRQLQ